MISIASDCLLFQLANGESVPFSADMISVELSSGCGKFDPHFVQHAAHAVFHYFKDDLGRLSVTVAEFAGALDKVLRGFGLSAQIPQPAAARPRVLELDLRQLACESGKGFELFFFPRLRDEVRFHLQHSPRVLRFRGLRSCVKQLAGAQRWCPRCRTLQDQIVEYLRHCFTTEASRADCALLVE